MRKSVKRTILMGYGNPGRLDDGLGQAFCREMTRRKIAGLTIESDYQLQVELAHTISQYDTVIFADATTDRSVASFSWAMVIPTANGISFSSHSVTPAELLGLTETLFGRKVRAYVLGIRGYEFDQFGERLSKKALANLAKASDFLEDSLRNNSLGARIERSNLKKAG